MATNLDDRTLPCRDQKEPYSSAVLHFSAMNGGVRHNGDVRGDYKHCNGDLVDTDNNQISYQSDNGVIEKTSELNDLIYGTIEQLERQLSYSGEYENEERDLNGTSYSPRLQYDATYSSKVDHVTEMWEYDEEYDGVEVSEVGYMSEGEVDIRSWENVRTI